MTLSITGLARRALQAGKRKLIHQLGFVSDQKFYLDSAMVQPRTDVDRIAVYSDVVELEFVSPVDGTKARNYYRPRFVYGLNGATVDPIPNLVYDSTGQFIAESSSWLALRQFYSWPAPRIRVPRNKLRGEFIFLPSNGYYHWLIEDLPVFLKSLAVAPRAKVLLSKNAAGYVREVTHLIDNEIVILDSPVCVERLIMTGKTAGIGSPSAGLTPHPADVEILRAFFSQYRDSAPCYRKLYLSRLGQKRSPANESDLVVAMGEQGFGVFYGTGMSLIAQITLFSSAKQLIGMHGAALSNIIWAPEGVDVCEVFSSGYMPSCYSALTAIRSGCYTAVSYSPGPENVVDAASIKRIVGIARRAPSFESSGPKPYKVGLA